MNHVHHIIILLCCSQMAYSATTDSVTVTYCPDIKNIEAMCQTDGPYEQSQTPFPACLMYEVGDSHTFYGNQRWRLSAFRPPSLQDPISFDKANVDSTGTHCIYKTIREDHYIRFSLDKHTKLIPYNVDTQNNFWKNMLSGKHNGVAASSTPSGNIYTCKLKNACLTDKNGEQVCPTKIDIHNCPFKNWHPPALKK